MLILAWEQPGKQLKIRPRVLSSRPPDRNADRMFPLRGLGDRLHPELDEPYIANPDRVVADPLSATELRRVWSEVNNRLIAAFERFTLEDWLHKHTAVSDEDFAKDPGRNRLAVVLSRTNHMSYHLGQIMLAHSRN